ncbi:hypothetical protein C6A85_69460, partial [Mycobacterium sp. ITM-2017-0098]
AWRGLGMGSTSGFVAAQLAALGMGTIGADDAMRALDSAMRGDGLRKYRQHNDIRLVAVPMLADIAPTGDQDSGDTVVGPGDEDLAEWVARQVVEAVA